LDDIDFKKAEIFFCFVLERTAHEDYGYYMRDGVGAGCGVEARRDNRIGSGGSAGGLGRPDCGGALAVGCAGVAGGSWGLGLFGWMGIVERYGES
jgi:hypothetical protein